MAPVLKPLPEKSPDRHHDRGDDHEVEAVHPCLRTGIAVPAFAKLHPDICQREAPEPRADERMDMEAHAVLVGVDNQACRRRRLPHRPHPFHIAVGPQSQFEQRPRA